MVATAARPLYCNAADVETRLVPQSTTTVAQPVIAPAREIYLTSLIAACSRRFDRLTGRLPGGFAPVYDQRYFCGRGAMNLRVDEVASISKVEYNTTEGQTPSWTDITADFAANRMQLLPLRGWPKTRLWRIQTFIVDPYRIGNVRITGVWGAVQPDGTTPAPAPPWQGLVTQGSINALSPDATANSWWVTPEDIVDAIARWATYAYHAGRAGYGQQASGGAAAMVQVPKQIPADVQAIINEYADTAPRVACVTTDGDVIADETLYGSVGSPDDVSRWADWQSYGVTGQTGGGS